MFLASLLLVLLLQVLLKFYETRIFGLFGMVEHSILWCNESY